MSMMMTREPQQRQQWHNNQQFSHNIKMQQPNNTNTNDIYEDEDDSWLSSEDLDLVLREETRNKNWTYRSDSEIKLRLLLSLLELSFVLVGVCVLDDMVYLGDNVLFVLVGLVRL